MTGIQFDGRLVYLWYGSDPAGQDCIAGRAGQLHTFASEDACRAMASARDWPSADGDDGVVEVTDLEPAQDWLRGKRMAIDPQAALDLWNWGADVAHSTSLPWNGGGAVGATCHDKLFAAVVPWVYKMESYSPIWSPRQLRVLREVLGQSVHLIRSTTRR
ncbi:hypothetical protein Ais01nite_84920 [Asanoa ishikariensis]|uniref:Uncharacterized protein n=1 Tax=Asanoa ishikariensis TaxID=137265 RepID=A0A1H3KAI3_9ACTN|nr:hypothetical protein Ais01nite_84920 [Asanoa ishikariensis]SDY48795.1 hypothetical protein SAMN05421684_0022 [Asanoa ishikariensis]